MDSKHAVDFKRIEEIISIQEANIESLKNEIHALESTHVMEKNKEMEAKNLALEEELKLASTALQNLLAEKRKLLVETKALQDTVANLLLQDKIDVLTLQEKTLRKKSNLFLAGELERILKLETDYQEKLIEARSMIENNQMNHEKKILFQLLTLENTINAAVAEQKKSFVSMKNQVSEEIDQTMFSFDRHPIDEVKIKEAVKKAGIEFKIGLNITNILGVFLVLLGVIFGLQYVYKNYLKAPEIRMALAYLLGLLFLLGGEFSHRKKQASIFSLGLTSAGVAILFATTGISFFGLEILTMPMALLFIFLTTVVSFLLSIRYNFQIISCFALVGGYLPIVTFGIQNFNVYGGVLIYLVILNAYGLFIAARRDWTIVKYVTLILNTVISFYLLTTTFTHEIIFVFIQIMFFMFHFVALIYPKRQKTDIKPTFEILVIANTVIHGILVFTILNEFSFFAPYFGLVSILLGVLYFLLARYIENNFKKTKLRVFFYIVATMMAILAVPLQVDTRYIALFWLFEALAFILVGIRSRRKIMTICGGLIYILSFASFIFLDTGTGIFEVFFLVRSAFMVAGLLIIFLFTIWEDKRNPFGFQVGSRNPISYLHNGTVFVLWGYSIYVTLFGLSRTNLPDNEAILLFAALVITINFILGIYLRKVQTFATKGTRTVSNIVSIFSGVCVLLLNMLILPGIRSLFIGTPIVNSINILLSVFYITIITDDAYNRGITGKSHKVLGISLYGLIVLNQIIFTSFDFITFSILTSFILIIDAAILVFLGFSLRYTVIRRAGLVLEILAVIKFFIFDLSYLQALERIISYFIFGGVLLLISFIYQKAERKLIKPLDEILPVETTAVTAEASDIINTEGEADE